MLESYISNLQNNFAKIIFSSNISKEDKLILLALNYQRAWLKYEGDTITVYDGKERKELEIKDLHRLTAKKSLNIF